MKKVAIITLFLSLLPINNTINANIATLIDVGSTLGTEVMIKHRKMTDENLISLMRTINFLGPSDLLEILLIAGTKGQNIFSTTDTITNRLVARQGLRYSLLLTYLLIKKLSQTQKGKRILENLGWQDVIENTSLATLNGVKAIKLLLSQYFYPLLLRPKPLRL